MDQDQLKQAVAQAAVDYVLEKIDNDSIVGIGTGSTANYFIDLIAEHKHRFAGTVASSEGSAKRLLDQGMPVYELNAVSDVRIYVDGADEANAHLQLIKGGGAALTREKIVTAVAQEFVCIADESKWVQHLGTFPLPVEVIPMARSHVARELVKLGGDLANLANLSHALEFAASNPIGEASTMPRRPCTTVVSSASFTARSPSPLKKSLSGSYVKSPLLRIF